MTLRHRMLTTRKRSDQKHPCLTSGGTVVEGFVGTIGGRGASTQHSSFQMTWIMPLSTFLSSTLLAPRSLRTRGGCGHLLLRQPKQPGHHPSPPGALLGVPRSRLVSGIIVTVSCCNQHKYLIRFRNYGIAWKTSCKTYEINPPNTQRTLVLPGRGLEYAAEDEGWRE